MGNAGETERKGWNWSRISDGYRLTPSPEVYYFLHRWKDLGLLRMLDLGCGLGRHSLLFAEHGFSVTGFDLSEDGLGQLLEQALHRNLPLGCVQGDITGLPFEDGSFDSILAYHSVYHVDTPGMARVMREMLRVLRPGGEIQVSMISKAAASFSDPGCRIIDGNVRMKLEEEGIEIPHYFIGYEEIEELFLGFEALTVRHVEDYFGNGSGRHFFIHARKL